MSRLGLDAVEVVDDWEAHGHKARPVIFGEAQSGREVEGVATGVRVFHAGFDLFSVPLTVEFEPQGPTPGL